MWAGWYLGPALHAVTANLAEGEEQQEGHEHEEATAKERVQGDANTGADGADAMR